jgi:hypothetical protein
MAMNIPSVSTPAITIDFASLVKGAALLAVGAAGAIGIGAVTVMMTPRKKFLGVIPRNLGKKLPKVPSMPRPDKAFARGFRAGGFGS